MFPSQLNSVNCNKEQLTKYHVRNKVNGELNLECKYINMFNFLLF